MSAAIRQPMEPVLGVARYRQGLVESPFEHRYR